MQARFFRAGLRAELTTDERKGKRRANGHTEQKRPPRGKMRGREIREEPARGSDAEELESRGADKTPRQQDPGHDPKRGTDQGGRHFQGIQTAAASPGQSIASYTLRQILPKMERNAKRQGNGHTEPKNATRGKAEGKTGANLGISCKSILVRVYYTRAAGIARYT